MGPGEYYGGDFIMIQDVIGTVEKLQRIRGKTPNLRGLAPEIGDASGVEYLWNHMGLIIFFSYYFYTPLVLLDNPTWCE